MFDEHQLLVYLHGWLTGFRNASFLPKHAKVRIEELLRMIQRVTGFPPAS